MAKKQCEEWALLYVLFLKFLFVVFVFENVTFLIRLTLGKAVKNKQCV